MAMKILLAVDGSPHSEAAVREVMERTWPAHSEIRVVTAYELPLIPTPESWTLPPDYFDRLEGAAREQAELVKDNAMNSLKSAVAADIKICGNILTGPPRSAILDEAERWQPDLIIIGSRGYGAWQRFLLGSVSQAVISHAKCSVEVVRRPALHQAAA